MRCSLLVRSGTILVVALSLGFSACTSRQPKDCTCQDIVDIPVDHSMSSLPTICVHKGTSPPTQLRWRATDNTTLTITMPDWGSGNPTTTINPYPAAQCQTTYCVSGAFAGAKIPDCTSIPYSITSDNGSNSQPIYGRIIIRP